MLYDKEIEKKLPLNINDLYVIADFDKTLTESNSQSSWAVLADTDLMPKQYTKDRYNLYNTYRPIEIDNTLDEKIKFAKMREWYEKHIQLFISYKLKESTIKEVAESKTAMKLRAGAREFLEFLNKNNVPVIIISAGVGNFIELFLQNNNCYFPNIHIISNMIKFKDGVACGVENVIHSLNKNEAALTEGVQNIIKDKKQILLFGDQIGDTKMVSKEKRDQTISVAFLAEDTKGDAEFYKKHFDIVCEENTSYKELQDMLFN